MAISFVLALLASLVVLYPLGFFLLRAMRIRPTTALVAAPALTLCANALLGEAFYALGIPANPLTSVFVPAAIAFAISLVIGRFLPEREGLPEVSWNNVAIFAVVGLIFGIWHFVRQLPSLDAVFEATDIIKHAQQIQAFLDSDAFTSLHSTVYLAPEDVLIDPIPGRGFYPSAWHMVCALVAQLTKCSVPIAMNAVDLAFAALVYPLAMLCLVTSLFEDDRIVKAAALASVGIIAFPWAFLIFGPLFPNLGGLSCVPITVWAFLNLASRKCSLSTRLTFAMIFVLSSIGMALAHPNAVFTTAVVLIPFCSHEFGSLVERLSKTHAKAKRVLAEMLFLLAVFAAWTFVAYSPAFINITEHNWPLYTSPWEATVNSLSLAYTYGFMSHLVSQPIMALAVIIGAAKAVRSERLRWLVDAYVIAVVTVIICASTEGWLKHTLGGFWYTDPVRLAATAGIIAAPLAALGLLSLAQALSSFYLKHRQRLTLKLRKRYLLPSAYVVLGLLVVFPTLSIPGLLKIENAFSGMHLQVKTQYARNVPYSDYERLFVEGAKLVVPEGTLVINQPFDGSVLAYGVDDLRCYYRERYGYGEEGETPESILIREHLNEIATNPEVEEAVNELGAEYVLVLDITDESSSPYLLWYYDPELFVGINSINRFTPGFELILTDGTCSLYRIAA